MTDQGLPPPVNGTELRLDALIARLDRLCDALAPAAPPEPDDGTVELREPAADGPPAAEKRRRR